VINLHGDLLYFINTETLQISTGNCFCYKELLNMEYNATTINV